MSKKTTTINIRVTPEEKAAFRAAAGGVDLSEIARQAFRRMVKRHERSEAVREADLARAQADAERAEIASAAS